MRCSTRRRILKKVGQVNAETPDAAFVLLGL
jgi:hypothetical protein